MGLLCFGSYATLLKEAMPKKPADKIVVPLLFAAIDKHHGKTDEGDFRNWRAATKIKLPAIISSPSTPPNAVLVEQYFLTDVLPKITDSNKRNTFHQKLFSLMMATSHFDSDLKSKLTKSLANEEYPYFNAQIFLFAIAQNNIASSILDDIDLLPLPKKPRLEATVDSLGFDKAFKPISPDKNLNLKNANFVRLFRLDIEGGAFIFDNLNDFLERNIGMYVHSRAKRDRLINDGHSFNIGKKAVELLRKAGGFSAAKIGEELGDIILYALLEHNLKAPKIYNKIQLTENGTEAVNQGGVHLLTIDDAESSFQVIVAKSNVVGSLKTAIDNAFDAVASAKNFSNERALLNASVLDMSFSSDVAAHLRSIILPSENSDSQVSVNPAFGVFLGYSIGIDPAVHSASEIRQIIESKIASDIQDQISYIESKIAEAKLGGCSFYFYVIPFNDANCEKVTLMKNLVGGVS